MARSRIGCGAIEQLREPMEAKLVAELPTGDGWQFEPKWDGFRALVARDGDEVEILSKSGKPLGRYFPEIVAMLGGLDADCFILDGELIVPTGGQLAFDALQARLHPAASRIERLARETPAQLILFDCLRVGKTALFDRPLSRRRKDLEAFHKRHRSRDLLLSPCANDGDRAAAWLSRSGVALDGVIAKRCDEPYRAGERAMLKVKRLQSADCVVGGIRRTGDKLASLLLGLYDDAGRLDHVGFLSALNGPQRAEAEQRIAPLVGGGGFTGKSPGGPSRWNTGRDTAWTPLKPELVVEVSFDQVTGARFRHGTRFLRWRPDKAPRQCTLEQLEPPLAPSRLTDLLAGRSR